MLFDLSIPKSEYIASTILLLILHLSGVSNSPVVESMCVECASLSPSLKSHSYISNSFRLTLILLVSRNFLKLWPLPKQSSIDAVFNNCSRFELQPSLFFLKLILLSCHYPVSSPSFKGSIDAGCPMTFFRELLELDS